MNCFLSFLSKLNFVADKRNKLNESDNLFNTRYEIERSPGCLYAMVAES